MRRRTLLLLAFNVFAATVGVFLVLTLLRTDDTPPSNLIACPRGDEALNPVTPAGAPVALNRSFDTIEQAEAFICHRVAFPREPGAWLIEDVSATRSRAAEDIANGRGFASVTLDYTRGDGADLRLEVSPFEIDPVTFGEIETVDVMGQPAHLIRGSDPDLVLLQWEARGYSFHTVVRLTDGFVLDDVYAVLNSIR